MATYNNICVFDFETGGKNPHECEITQIGACIIDRWNLKIIDEFKSMAKPENLDSVEQGALDVTGFTIAQLEKAPNIKLVWSKFVNWVNKHNKSKGNLGSYMAPIPAGYNILGYDMIIVNRYCKEYGPWNDNRGQQKLFNPIYKIDLMDHMWFWTENNPEIKSLKLTSVCEWLGFDKEDIENAHDALQDVHNTSKIIIRLLNMQRGLTGTDGTEARLSMKGSFADA
tara:strand:+ start:622 stop:1299 length:678 start_codon:yes stop_codon:yes gene_type:complete